MGAGVGGPSEEVTMGAGVEAVELLVRWNAGLSAAVWACLCGSSTISTNVPIATANKADPDCAIARL